MVSERTNSRVQIRVHSQQVVTGRRSTHDFVPWRHEVRLDEIIVVPDVVWISPITPSWASRTVRGYRIVTARIGAEGIGSAYRYRGRLVPRSMDLTIEFVAAVVLAIISRRGDHDDARVNQTPHSLAERVVPVSVHGRCS